MSTGNARPDPGTDDHRGEGEVLGRHLTDRRGHVGHDAGDHEARELGLERHASLLQQPRERQGEFVGGALECVDSRHVSLGARRRGTRRGRSRCCRHRRRAARLPDPPPRGCDPERRPIVAHRRVRRQLPHAGWEQEVVDQARRREAGRDQGPNRATDPDALDLFERGVVDDGGIVETSQRGGADLPGHRGHQDPSVWLPRPRQLGGLAEREEQATRLITLLRRETGVPRRQGCPSASCTVGPITSATGNASRSIMRRTRKIRWASFSPKNGRPRDVEESVDDGEHALEVARSRRALERGSHRPRVRCGSTSVGG